MAWYLVEAQEELYLYHDRFICLWPYA